MASSPLTAYWPETSRQHADSKRSMKLRVTGYSIRPRRWQCCLLAPDAYLLAYDLVCGSLATVFPTPDSGLRTLLLVPALSVVLALRGLYTREPEKSRRVIRRLTDNSALPHFHRTVNQPD